VSVAFGKLYRKRLYFGFCGPHFWLTWSPSPFVLPDIVLMPSSDAMNFTETDTLDSPLGPLILAATVRGLSGVWFMDQRHIPSAALRHSWRPNPNNAVLLRAATQLTAYFSGRLRPFDLALDLSAGTAFQQSVWQALLHIPVGQTLSYGAIAELLNKPSASRAVGAAVGRNPISIVVPCHRVLGAGEQMTGYAGGLWRKEALLTLEGHLTPASSSVSTGS
jgi:methylated-DNA-[protein]-cysteine S-methyltransferase